MGYFFGFILFIFFTLLVIGISILSRLVGGVMNLFRMVFGKKNFGPRQNRGGGFYEEKRGPVGQTTLHETENVQKKKIIGEDEGEYVDFEEIPSKD